MTDRPFRFGVVAAQAASAKDWVEKARRVEALGFASLLVPDTLGHSLAPMVALTAAAGATSRLRLGTFVLASDYRHPVNVAREAAALDLLSDGRFELGLGAGRPGAEADLRRLGVDPGSPAARVERFAAALGMIDVLLRGEAVDGQAIYPTPVQRPRPPILVAASGPRMLALAARHADALALGLAPTASPEELGERVALVRAAAGARASQLELAANMIAVVPEGTTPAATPWGPAPAELVRSRSPFALWGSVEQMCQQLLERRERFGISYVAVGEHLIDAAAPVVARLAGQGAVR